jgi:hypothetical protein
MSDQLGEEAPAETAQPWDSVRRVREPVAWLLLVITAIWVLVSAWQLFGLPGAPVPVPVPVAARQVAVPVGAPVTHTPSPVPVTTFGLRASAVAPQFVAGGIFVLPVLAVILVAFAGGLTGRARQVVQAAVAIQAVALALGVLSWLGALGGHLRQGVWFIFDAADLAAVAAALIFTVAVLRSRALRPLTPQSGGFRGRQRGFRSRRLGGRERRNGPPGRRPSAAAGYAASESLINGDRGR